MTHQEIIVELRDLKKSYIYEDDDMTKTIIRDRIKNLEKRIITGSF